MLKWSGLVVVLLAGGIAGCSSDEGGAQAGNTSSKPRVRHAASNVAGDMVAAVPAGSSGSHSRGIVDLKFSLGQRPDVGKAVEVSLALIPSMDLERLFARFQGGEGLELVSGAQTAPLTHLSAGQPVEHTVTVMARHDGIFNLTAVVLADSPAESVARTFSIPVIAGTGLPPWVSKNVATAAEPAAAGRSAR